MAETDEPIVTLQDNFYRDSFTRVIVAFFCLFLGIALLVGLSLYLYWNKPKPTTFMVGEEFRIQPSVPLEEPYLSTADVAQWLNDVLRRVFVFDFVNYNTQLQDATEFFTPDGWKAFLNQLNIYVNYTNVQSNKLFVNSTPAGAPYILNQGLLSGRYGWWFQMPITINFSSNNQSYRQTLTLQLLVVRVSTLNNLNGVAIDNIIVANPGKRQAS